MVTELKNDTWEETLSKERIAVVKCYADWCGPCKFYAPHFQKFSENISVYNDTEIKYYQINNDKSLSFKREFKVTSLPSMLFFVHGVLVYKIEGVTREKVFKEILEKSLNVKFRVKGEQDECSTTGEVS